jgi:hypothetical protein
MVTTIVHELAHAIVAYAFGVRSTLFSYFVDLDLTPTQAASPRGAMIGVAGPLVCLLVGAVSWFAFRRLRNAEAGVPLLYFTVFGLGTFFGNSMSIAFVGDFSSVAVTLGLPMGVRYAVAVIGALSAAAIHFWAGRELSQWTPAGGGRVSSLVGITALPAVLGTAVVIVVNQPMPAAFAAARLGEASFWLFAVAGALATKRRSLGGRGHLLVRWIDIVAVLLAALVVRLLVPGISFAP